MTEERASKNIFVSGKEWSVIHEGWCMKKAFMLYFLDEAMEAIFNESLCVLQPAKNPET